MSTTSNVGAFSIDSFLETSCMVGLDFGLVAKHANASLAINTNLNATWFLGGLRRWSKISFNCISWVVGVVVDDDNDDERNEMRSLGWFPMITSNVNTPNL